LDTKFQPASRLTSNSIKDVIAEGDKVMVRNSWTATEASTGQQIEFHGFVLWRFSNKKIVERWATITPPKVIDE
jgi:predicted ester cyclase